MTQHAPLVPNSEATVRRGCDRLSRPATTWRWIAGGCLAALLAVGCGGDDGGEERAICSGQTARVDVAEGGDVTTDEFSDDELASIESACAVTENLDDDFMDTISHAFVVGDFTTLCATFDAAADQAETNLPAAVQDGGASDMATFVIGEAVRFGSVEELSDECGDAVARYVDAFAG